MISKLAQKIKLLPELYQKYKILRAQNLLDDRVTAKELEQYLFSCNSIGRHRGYLRSLRDGMCVDQNGDPVPWYTYPAIDQLAKWDFSDCEVFEYGCGNSTRWWAQRAKSVVSLESSQSWYEKILDMKVLPENVTPLLVSVEKSDSAAAFHKYASAINDFDQFDVIVIDGEMEHRTRYICAELALKHLKKGGLIIFDNSDWHPDGCRLLRDAGFFEIDYCGNGPLNTHSETTSLFFASDFRIKPLNQAHPGFTLGGLTLNFG